MHSQLQAVCTKPSHLIKRRNQPRMRSLRFALQQMKNTFLQPVSWLTQARVGFRPSSDVELFMCRI